MLPPEMREKVKTLPPGVLSQLRYRADVMTGNGEASAAVNSADAYRQTGVGKSDSAIRNFRENVGIGAVQPVGEAIDTVKGLHPINMAERRTTNKVFGNPDNYAGVIAGGNLIADKSDRIKGYNQNISAAIASGDPDRIKMIPQFRTERDKLTGAVANVSKTLTGKDYELDGASEMSQAMATRNSKGDGLGALINAPFSVAPPWVLANTIARGSVYGAEGGPGLGKYITPENRGLVSDVLGATLVPGVGMAAEGVGGGATRVAKGLANRLIPREIAATIPKAAPAVLTPAQQAAQRLAGKLNLPKFDPISQAGIADNVGGGIANVASGMLNPKGYGLSDMMYPAGAAYGRIRQGLKSKLDPSKGVAGLVNLLQSKANDGTSPQASAAPNPVSASAALASGLTPLQKALIAGGISIPAAIALSRTIGSKGSDELPNEGEEAQL
jgi:hypothetical protein